MDDRPRAHVCRGRSHHRRRCRHPAQCHRPDTRGRLIHLCRAACRHSLQDCLPHRRVDDRRGTDPPLSRRRCGMECLCRALRAALFVPKRTRRATRADRLRLRHVRARGCGILLRPRQCHRQYQDIPLRPHHSRLETFESLRHPCGFQPQRLSVL